MRRTRAALAAANRLTVEIDRSASMLDRVSKASLAKAFRGELVGNEATLAEDEGRDYESAEQLLTRVRAAKPIRLAGG